MTDTRVKRQLVCIQVSKRDVKHRVTVEIIDFCFACRLVAFGWWLVKKWVSSTWRWFCFWVERWTEITAVNMKQITLFLVISFFLHKGLILISKWSAHILVEWIEDPCKLIWVHFLISYKPSSAGCFRLVWTSFPNYTHLLNFSSNITIIIN